MTTDEGLRSVNWISGMLLTPEHFGAQDRYIDESIGWLLRHCIPATGLVGAGVRVNASERGLVAQDPRIEVSDDGRTVAVTVLQARGITGAGEAVDVPPEFAARGESPKAELAGAKEVYVYVVRTGEREEVASSVGSDPANPTMPAFRRQRYEIRFGVPADVLPHALVVGRLRRASESLAFERDSQFIPACATMLAHSELYAGWSRIQSDLALLTGEFGELHRAVARYAEQVARRNVDARGDLDVLAFTERAVLALDHCASETADPAMDPARCFEQLDRLGRRVALALDLSSSTQSYFQTLAGTDATYTDLLAEERAVLGARRERTGREDLRQSLARANDTISRIRRLAQALEGKYVDYRVNRSVDAVQFLLDRQGEQFYVAVATPGHPQREGDLLTFVFSQLSLTGRHEYRLVLLGDPQGTSSWQVGDEAQVDLRINADGAPGRPVSRSVTCEIPGQRNFGVNFETPPDVATIAGLSVQVQPAQRIRGAILFQRKLGLVTDAAPLAMPAPAASASPPRQHDAPASPPPLPMPKITIRKPTS
ncbi:MAG: hypothetical protein H0U85_08540 [Gemmatimonadales bacterium]|nr:hypothetical protein [Gemmatimonadales bacterium]